MQITSPSPPIILSVVDQKWRGGDGGSEEERRKGGGGGKKWKGSVGTGQLLHPMLEM